MELRQYWQIIRRHTWIVITLPLVVLLITLLTRPTRTPTYVASMRFMMGLQPEVRNGEYYTYDRYYTWLTAEYLVDDVSELVRSTAFAQAVSEHLAGTGIHVPAGAIHSATQPGTLHRILTVNVFWGNSEQLADIANAIAAVLPTEIARHFAQVGTGGVNSSLIDPPTISAVGPGLREKLDIPLRLFLALAAGIALAFVLDYLDDTVRNKMEVEQSGLEVLAEIPATKTRRWDFTHRRLP